MVILDASPHGSYDRHPIGCPRHPGEAADRRTAIGPLDIGVVRKDRPRNCGPYHGGSGDERKKVLFDQVPQLGRRFLEIIQYEENRSGQLGHILEQAFEERCDLAGPIASQLELDLLRPSEGNRCTDLHFQWPADRLKARDEARQTVVPKGGQSKRQQLCDVVVQGQLGAYALDLLANQLSALDDEQTFAKARLSFDQQDALLARGTEKRVEGAAGGDIVGNERRSGTPLLKTVLCDYSGEDGVKLLLALEAG